MTPLKKIPPTAPVTGFSYARAQFEQLVEDALAYAASLGADAEVEVSEAAGLSVNVRKGDLEHVERHRDKSFEVSVYLGQRRGNASTSDFSRTALEQTVRAAYDIARFTAADPASGLPETADLAFGSAAKRDLDLFDPWLIEPQVAAQLALRGEAAALDTDPRITNAEGASVEAQQSHFFMGNSRGFRGGFPSAYQSLSVGAIACEPGQQGDDMQRDAWYSTQRRAQDLASPEAVGRYAAERALSRLNGRKISTCEVPVLFESTEALGLMDNYVRATGGVRLYQKSSFLLDTLGLEVMAPHLDLHEDPHQLRGLASAPFDAEGVTTRPRDVVKAGVVQGYFLSTYSARKLGLRTTGHAGGSHNLVWRSRLTQASDNLEAMLRKLHCGLFVTEQLGQGVNYVTGDYSRGAAGFWVEDGRIAYPVHEVTIAGNLKNIFKQIVAIGADTFTQGGYTSGSVLVERMKVAGS